MKTFLNIIGGILLLGGIGWGVYIIVAVAAHTEGFEALKDMIPALAGHAVAMFIGMVLIGLGLRKSDAVA